MEKSLLRWADELDDRPADIPMTDVNSFCRVIGFEDVWAFEEKWGGPAG